MKTALCLHGYLKNAGGLNAFFESNQYLESKIFKKCDVDIFTHSWDIDNINEYENIYKTKTKLKTFEKQKDFSTFDICKNQRWFDEEFQNREDSPLKNNTIERTLSFLYSRKSSIDLKTEYELKNNFKYDCVIIARFDLGTRGKEYPQKYYATNINFIPDSNMEFLHCAYWDQFNHGLPDHWFYSSSDNINKVSQLYNYVFEYYKIDSDYVDSCINGWITSNNKEQFSNEMLKKEEHQSKDLLCWPKYMCIDNHKLYKWHITKHNIKLKLVDITE